MKAISVVREALDDVKIIDPHCHLRPEKPSADNLADILLYHHLWIELISSGMDQFEVTKSGFPHELVDPEIPPLERVKRAVQYLPCIRNTTVGLFFRWIMKDLFNMEDALGERNIEKIFHNVGERCSDPLWEDKVLRNYCGIEYNITVNTDTVSSSKRMLQGKEGVPVNIVREYIVSGKENPMEVLGSMEKDFGKEIKHVSDYLDYLQLFSKYFLEGKYKFAGIWILPCITDEMSEERYIDSIIKKVKNGKQLSLVEIGSFCYFGTVSFLKELRKSKTRTIQILTGAYVLPPHRSITRWNRSFVESIGKIAYEFEDFHFSISSASDIYTHDLGILAKHIPNVSIAGYWWHTLYPFYIKKSLETRLDMVPMNKIIGFFSDTYHIEWCYPKLKMVKSILKDILIERINRGWYDTKLACVIINKLFYENPRKIYNIETM
ncbi:MAG: hypothetical protein AMS17_14335 [Spirochaetes bacterium DG_61]|nr:MAG: hypothetical protein AMS17_14335 [Spirochaetes bacterium DG_61]